MPSTTFACPHCATPLRVRDRTLIGRQFPCPDCTQTILVSSDGPRGFSIQKGQVEEVRVPEPISAAKPAAAKPAVPIKNGKLLAPVRRTPSWQTALSTPQGIIWAITGVFCVAALALFVQSNASDARTTQASTDATSENAIAAAPSNVASKPDAVNEPEPQAVAEAKVDAAPNPEPPATTVPEPAAVAELIPNVDVPIEPAFQDEPIFVQAPPEPAPQPPEPVNLNAEPIVQVDVGKALEQKIAMYQLSKPAALGEVLLEVEAMAAVPIRYDDLDSTTSDAMLATRVTANLQDTTIGAILQTLLTQAGMTHKVEFDGVRILPAGQVDGGSK